MIKTDQVSTGPQIVSFANDLPSSASAAQSFATQETCEVDEIDYNRPFPWIKVVVKLLGSLNFTCSHHEVKPHGHMFSKRNIFKAEESQDSQSTAYNPNTFTCSIDCFLRQFKSSHCLIEAVLRMYEASNRIRIAEKFEKVNEAKEIHKQNSSLSSKSSKKTKGGGSLSKAKKKDSSSQQSSHRLNYLNSLLKKTSSMKQSIDRKRDLKASQSGTATKLDPSIPTIDYIHNQIQNLNQIPLLVLCKGILVMQDEHFDSLVPIVWNLLLNSDQDIASAAATLFNISAIKQPRAVEDLIKGISVKYIC